MSDGGRLATFDSLRVRDFRLFMTGHLVSSVGTWLQQVAETWLMLQLTGDGLAVGAVVLARFAPVLTIGLWGGAVADRFDKRSVLHVTQSVRGLAAAALGVLALGGHATAPAILVLALVAGTANAIDNPVRRAFVGELVAPEQLVNAVSLYSTVMATSRVVGPLLAGALIATVGVGWCFVVNAVSYVAVLWALAAMDVAAAPRERRDLGDRPVRDGLRHVAADPAIWLPLVMVGLVSLSGWNWETLLALHATTTFDGTAATFTVMFTVLSAGTLVGALANAGRREVGLGSLTATATALGVAMWALALVPGLAPTFVLLVPCGASVAMFNTASNALLQRTSRGPYHGRVMAVFSALFVGSKGIGGVVAGSVAGGFGPRAGIAVGGCGCLGAGLVGSVAGRRLRGRPHAGSRCEPTLAMEEA